MRKRITKIVIATLIFVLVVVLIIAIRLWFYFRSPEAMERMGWEHADGSGGYMSVKPGEKSFDGKIIFGQHEDSLYRLKIDCEIESGALVIETFKIKDYDPLQGLIVSDEQKELVEKFEIKESCERIFDFEKYEVGNYLITIDWKGDDAYIKCSWTLENNLYVWQSRYNSFIITHPWVKEKIRGGYGIHEGDYVDD